MDDAEKWGKVRAILEEVNVLKGEVKARSMKFQADAKSAYATLLGLGFDDLIDMDYESWSRLQRVVIAFKDEAEAAYVGPSDVMMGQIWEGYAKQHPDKIAAIVARLGVGEFPTFDAEDETT